MFYGGALAYFLALGTVIIWRVPGNRIGWVFALMAAALGLAGVTGTVGASHGSVFDAIGNAAWMGWIGSIFLLLMLYPTGHLLGGMWRFAGWLTVALVAFAVVATLFAEELCIEAGVEGCDLWADNPIGIAGIPYPEYWGPSALLVLVVLGLSLASLVARYRRSDVVRRLQLKWFLFAGAGFVGSILIEVAYTAAGREPPGWVGLLNGLALLAIPFAATMAILRYRLYEIDRIVSRTVSYTLVVGLLGLLVAGISTVVGTRFEEPMVVAGTTLLVAASFSPLRRRIQGIVDRRFNRPRYDREKVIDRFAGSLQDRVDPDGVVDGWVDVVTDTMQPGSVGVWVRE